MLEQHPVLVGVGILLFGALIGWLYFKSPIKEKTKKPVDERGSVVKLRPRPRHVDERAETNE